jgi:TadE-like protein
MKRHLSVRRGQSMVELVLALPVVLILGLGVADIGRAFYYREAVGNAARQALRIAVLEKQQATGDTACHGGGHRGSLSTTLPPVSGDPLSTIGNEVSLESTSNGLPTGSALSGATLTMTWNCSANIALTHATATSTDPAADASDSIEVRITYPMPLITPFLGGIIASPVQIKADIQGRVQY